MDCNPHLVEAKGIFSKTDSKRSNSPDAIAQMV